MNDRIDVDFNNLREDGRLIVYSESPLKQGQRVVAVDDAEDMEFTGTVTGFSESGHCAYLTMDWEPVPGKQWAPAPDIERGSQ